MIGNIKLNKKLYLFLLLSCSVKSTDEQSVLIRTADKQLHAVPVNILQESPVLTAQLSAHWKPETKKNEIQLDFSEQLSDGFLTIKDLLPLIHTTHAQSKSKIEQEETRKNLQNVYTQLNLNETVDLVKWYDYLGINRKNRRDLIKNFAERFLKTLPDEKIFQVIDQLPKDEEKMAVQEALLQSPPLDNWFNMLHWNKNGIPHKELRGHKGAITASAIDPLGKKIVTGSEYDDTICVWDLESGKLLNFFTEHGGCLKVLIDQTGKKLIIAPASKSNYEPYLIKVYELESGNCLCTLPGGTNLAITPSGEKLVVGNDDRSTIFYYDDINVFDLNSGSLLWSRHTYTTADVFAIDPYGTKVIVGGKYNESNIFDLNNYRKRSCKLYGYTENEHVKAIAIDPSGNIVAIGSGDGYIYIRDIHSGKSLHVIAGNNGPIRNVIIDPTGEKLITLSWSINIWNLKSGKLLRTITSPKDTYFTSIVVDPFCKQIAAGWNTIGGKDETVTLIWDLESCNLLQTLFDHNKPIYPEIFDPSGKKFVSVSPDGTAQIWDLSTPDNKLTLQQILFLKIFFNATKSLDKSRKFLMCSHKQDIRRIYESLPEEIKKLIRPNIQIKCGIKCAMQRILLWAKKGGSFLLAIGKSILNLRLPKYNIKKEQWIKSFFKYVTKIKGFPRQLYHKMTIKTTSLLNDSANFPEQI